MNKLKYIIATSVMFLVFGNIANSQTVTPTPKVIPNACKVFEQAAEEAADLAKRKQIEIDGLKSQLDLANQKIALRDEQIANKEEQIGFWKSAYEKGTKVDTNSQLIVENLRVQINDYKNENQDLRRENSSLRSSRNWRTFAAFGIGMGAGYYVGNKH